MRIFILKNRRSIRTCFVLLALLVAAVSHRTRSQTSSPTTGTAPTPIPQRILYFQLFNHVAYLDYASGVATQQGQTASALSLGNYYQVHASLTTAETALLKSTAHAELTSLAALDQQAQALIVTYRAQFPAAGWSRKKPLPAPPAELHTLQVTRDNITMSNVAALQSGFGADFQRFDTYVQSALGPHITVTTATTPAAPPSGGTAPPALPVPWK
jgi:hypothetical protein